MTLTFAFAFAFDFDFSIHKDMGFRVGGVAGGEAPRREGSGKERRAKPAFLCSEGETSPLK